MFEVDVDVGDVVVIFVYYVKLCEDLVLFVVELVVLLSDGVMVECFYDLVGVVVLVMLWNFLMVMIVWKFVFVFVVGCVVVLKLFEFMLLIEYVLFDIVIEVGVLVGVVNVVNGDVEIGVVLIVYLLIDKILFMGSMVVGCKVM